MWLLVGLGTTLVHECLKYHVDILRRIRCHASTLTTWIWLSWEDHIYVIVVPNEDQTFALWSCGTCSHALVNPITVVSWHVIESLCGCKLLLCYASYICYYIVVVVYIQYWTGRVILQVQCSLYTDATPCSFSCQVQGIFRQLILRH